MTSLTVKNDLGVDPFVAIDRAELSQTTKRQYGDDIVSQRDKPKLQPHDLRRTFAQFAVDNGIPIQRVSKLLGHASIQTTIRYLNLETDLEIAPSQFIPL